MPSLVCRLDASCQARIRPVTAFEANRKTRQAYDKNPMKKRTENPIAAEAVFSAELYKKRATLNQKAQSVLASGPRQVTLRLGNSEIALAKQQAEAKGLRYQTYIKMLLHEALSRTPSAR